MTIFNVTGGSSGGGGDDSPTFKEMTTTLYDIKENDWGDHYTVIPSYFFAYDELLNSIEIKTGITQIGNYTFTNCNYLKNVKIPQTVNSIGNNCFSSCIRLEEIEIPQGITLINSKTFYFCKALEKITLPQSLTVISSNAFYSLGSDTTDGCTLTMLPTTPPTIQANSFNDARFNKIIVPQGSLTAYQTATNWSAYAQYMEEAA